MTARASQGPPARRPASTRVGLLDDPDRVRTALSPPRRRLLALLREPASATQLAGRLNLSRQRVNYHLKALERAGLVELVEERRRRGFTERVLRARAERFVTDPAVLGEPALDQVTAQDRYAADHLVGTAADTVRDVARMQATARREGTRLLTFTIETEVGFAEPADVEGFCDRLAERIHETALEFSSPEGRRYRVVVGGHPDPAPEQHAGTSLGQQTTSREAS